MIPGLLNHLWQSSIFGAVAALLALGLPTRPARVRFGIWTVASLKFLVPFALLATLGNHLAWRPPTSVPDSQVLRGVAEPFVATPVPTESAPAAIQPVAASTWPALLNLVWLAGAVTVFAVWLTRWARLARLVREGRPDPLGCASLPMRWTTAMVEPGVFGVFRPVLLLPTGIAKRLSPDQLTALVAHEQCHVRRRDNFWALIHMLVEVAFWFFPPVWWIGTQLIAERERACDEAVLEGGADPGSYAEAVVQVCRYCVAAPVPCVSGVAGADLKRRIVDIVNYAGQHRLPRTATLGMAAFLAAVMAAPLAAGRLYSPWQERSELPAPKLAFDVASVRARPSESFTAGRSGVFMPSPGRLAANCVGLRQLVEYGYGVDHRYQDVLGGPSWAGSRSPCNDGHLAFFIEATMPPDTTPIQAHEMMRSLLIERFKLRVHAETRQEKVLALVVAPSGVTLKPSDPTSASPRVGMVPRAPCPQDDLHCNHLLPGAMAFDSLADYLSAFSERPVIDRTGLRGRYVFPPEPYQWRSDDAPGSSLPTLAELLKSFGLNLRSDIGPVDYLVIDHAEMPTGNGDALTASTATRSR